MTILPHLPGVINRATISTPQKRDFATSAFALLFHLSMALRVEAVLIFTAPSSFGLVYIPSEPTVQHQGRGGRAKYPRPLNGAPPLLNQSLQQSRRA